MPKHEAIRLHTLHSYRISEPDVINMFDDMVNLATEGCNKPMAMVSFVQADTHFVSAQVGNFPQQIEYKKSLFSLAIAQHDVFEVCDTLNDKQTKHNEFVLETPFIRYYAAVPLLTPDKQLLGFLSVMDTQPNVLSKQENSILLLIARDLISQLELRRKNHELAKIKDLYEQITENNQDLIFAKDSEFKILHANSAFLSLYPEDMRDKVIGYTTLEKYSQEEADGFLMQDKLAFEKGQTDTIEKIMFPSGDLRTLHTTKTRFKDNEGKAYILGVARDITEREELIEKLKKSNADLDEFAYIASHDLKAPLNAIKRLVSWIEEDAAEALQDDSVEHIGMIKSRIDRMNMLLKDLLNYSRIGKNDGAPQPLKLRETAKNCFELLDLPDGFSIEVDEADLILPKLPLELVLTNLMSNAIKHHDKNSGVINISCHTDQHNYILIVQDDGPGIAASMHDKIFKKFQTLKPRDEVEGSGLGLAMVEKALKNYAGKITIESDIGKGSTFIITWPKISGSST